MNNLRIYNEKVFNEYLSLSNKENLAFPNLVSSKIFLDKVCKNPIMYIGEETNGWINYKDNYESNIDYIEDAYDYFYTVRCTSKTIFWKFLKKVTEVNYDEMYKNIIWCNTIISGKRYDKGAPIVDYKLRNLSIEYLIFLYNFFKPRIIIDVSGNKEVYSVITKEFFKSLNIDLQDKNLDKDNILLESNNVFWTYHPNRLLYLSKYSDVSNKILSKVKSINGI